MLVNYGIAYWRDLISNLLMGGTNFLARCVIQLNNYNKLFREFSLVSVAKVAAGKDLSGKKEPMHFCLP